jgi:hypothetical protein
VTNRGRGIGFLNPLSDLAKLPSKWRDPRIVESSYHLSRSVPVPPL